MMSVALRRLTGVFLPMPAPYQTTRLVEFSDTDMAGIMHFAAFFRYMEASEHELLRSLGLSVYSKIDGEIVSFPRVAASCQYYSPARCEEILDIEVSVTRLGTKSITYRFAFHDQGRHVATGEMTSVCCRVLPGQSPSSIPIPEQLAAKLRAHVDNS